MAVLKDTQPFFRAQGELDRIYSDPGTGHALDLFERFAKRSLNEAGLSDFLNGLPADAAPERAKLEQLMAGNNVDADLSTRSGQLVWAAGLDYLVQNLPPGAIRNHRIWSVVCSNPVIKETLQTAARAIELSPVNKNATIGFGTPGSGF